MELITYPDRELMELALADRLASGLAAALRGQARASLCLPGGTTPGPVLDILSDLDLDWGRVTVFPGDERWVDMDSPRSNARLLRERLLRGRAAAAQLVPLYLPGARPEDRLAEIEETLRPHLPITVLLLGMGEDMHTASLFPGADRLAEALAPDAPILVPIRAPAAPEPRVTLSARVLRAAQRIEVMITGPEKRAALDRAQNLPPAEAPIRALLDHATVHWAE